MQFVIINALLYLLLMLFYWRKRKVVDCGFLLIAVWASISIMGVILYFDDPVQWRITPQYFFYLFGAFVLFSRMYIFPSAKSSLSVEGLAFHNNKALDVMCVLFVFCALFNILNSDFSMSSVSMEEIERNAADNYSDHIDSYGEKGYTNFIERFTLNYCSWFKVAALIGMYNYLCQRRNGFAVILAFSIFMPTFLNSIMMGTRGTLFTEIILFVSTFLLYKKYIPKKTKKNIYAVASVMGALSLIFVIAVTNSRFSDSKMGASGSVLWYFGQSMLYFDNGLADSVSGMLYGLRTFKTLFSYFGVSLPEGFMPDFFLGTNFGTNFTTFIGMLILDFGFIGTLIVGAIVPWIINKLCTYKNSFTVASLYLYLFFLNRLIMGVFSNGSGIDFQYIVAFIFYFFFRFVFDTRTKNVRVSNIPQLQK